MTRYKVLTLIIIIVFGFIVSDFYEPKYNEDVLSAEGKTRDHKTKGSILPTDQQITSTINDIDENALNMIGASTGEVIEIGDYVNIDDFERAFASRQVKHVGDYIPIDTFIETQLSNATSEPINIGEFLDVEEYLRLRGDETTEMARGSFVPIDDYLAELPAGKSISIGESKPVNK